MNGAAVLAEDYDPLAKKLGHGEYFTVRKAVRKPLVSNSGGNINSSNNNKIDLRPETVAIKFARKSLISKPDGLKCARSQAVTEWVCFH